MFFLPPESMKNKSVNPKTANVSHLYLDKRKIFFCSTERIRIGACCQGFVVCFADDCIAHRSRSLLHRRSAGTTRRGNTPRCRCVLTPARPPPLRSHVTVGVPAKCCPPSALFCKHDRYAVPIALVCGRRWIGVMAFTHQNERVTD